MLKAALTASNDFVAYRQSSSSRSVLLRNATTIASWASVNTVDRGSVFISSTVARMRHFVTVLALTPSSRLIYESEACERSIAALTASASQERATR